jgi:hypothetical protein
MTDPPCAADQTNGILSIIIIPATKLVIPAAAERRTGIQKKPCNYWFPAFAGMTKGSTSDGLFN